MHERKLNVLVQYQMIQQYPLVYELLRRGLLWSNHDVIIVFQTLRYSIYFGFPKREDENT